MRRFVTLVLLVASCSQKSDDPKPVGGDTDATDPCASVAPLAASVSLSETINTVAFVSWSPPAAGESWVEYGLDAEALTASTPRVPTGDAVHEQVLLGLKADRTYHWRAVTEACGVRFASDVGTVTTGTPPGGVGPAQLNPAVDDPSRYDPAPWLLTITHGSDFPATLVIYDREGDPVWYYETPSDIREAHTARASWDGKSILYGFYDQNQVDDIGGIYRIGMDGRSELKTPTVEAHHDFVERRDGTLAYLTLIYRENLDVEGEIVNVVSDAIFETAEGVDLASTPPTSIFNQFDDSGQELYWTCDDMRSDFDGQPYKQWSHANSLMPDPVDPDNYYWVNYRYQDSLLKISRATHSIVWEIGGRYDDSDLTAEDAFDHGHMSHIWPGGFLMFDNNTHPQPALSRVREYAIDESTKHVALVNQWDGESYTPGMADAKKTASGTMIVNFSGDKVIREFTADGQVVWELGFGSTGPGRISLLYDLYDLDDPYVFADKTP